MPKPKKDLYRVGEILGPPTPIDPTRPNAQGGATPERLEPTDYPLYNTRKTCRVCRRNYKGMSQSPQYDDDPRLFGWCGNCALPVSAGLGQWPEPRHGRAAHSYRESAPVRQARDPLYD